ncbi:hypothetical protein FPV67DRAFT_997425 [Lyophyllum atratum]|nr:hypothetical protein FPV67DRAFT_997425 [Lyophyllum atratum]
MLCLPISVCFFWIYHTHVHTHPTHIYIHGDHGIDIHHTLSSLESIFGTRLLRWDVLIGLLKRVVKDIKLIQALVLENNDDPPFSLFQRTMVCWRTRAANLITNRNLQLYIKRRRNQIMKPRSRSSSSSHKSRAGLLSLCAPPHPSYSSPPSLSLPSPPSPSDRSTEWTQISIL